MINGQPCKVMGFPSAEKYIQKQKNSLKEVDLGFFDQMRASQDHLLDSPQTFQLSKGRYPPKTSSKRNGLILEPD